MSSTQTETIVRAPLNFYKSPEDGSQIKIQPWLPKQMEFNTREISVHDVRGREEDFTLDKNGFQYVKAPTTFKDWYNEDAVQNEYFKSIEELVKKTAGASRVHFFRYRLRDSSLSQNTGKVEGAAEFPHVDLSMRAAPPISDFMNAPGASPISSDWPTLSKSRWAMFSVWRPLEKVTRDALLVCDKQTAKDEDLIPYHLEFPELEAKGMPKTEGILINYDEGQKWYYKSEMEVDDVVMIKNFDTKGPVRCCPHGSFKSAGDYGEARKSLEARCFVFWEGESRE